MSAKAKLDRRGFLTRGLAIAGAALAGGCDARSVRAALGQAHSR